MFFLSTVFLSHVDLAGGITGVSVQFLKLQTEYDELDSYNDSLKRESTSLSEELRGLQEQISERGMNKFEMQRNNKRLEAERVELLEHIEDLENNLTTEQAKQLKTQLEYSQYRQEMERKLLEKDEEFENMRYEINHIKKGRQIPLLQMVAMFRKNHQKQLLVMKNSLEEEARSKNDQVRLKKGNEAKVQDLEDQTEQLKKVSNPSATMVCRDVMPIVCLCL